MNWLLILSTSKHALLHYILTLPSQQQHQIKSILLYSYITNSSNKNKPFTTATLEQIHLTCHKYQRQHLKHKQRSDNWIKISQREIAALITEEREKLLKPFERPRFLLPDFPPITRIRLFRQDLLGAESLSRFHYFCQDPRPIPDKRIHPEQGERVAHPRRTRKANTRIRKTVLLEPLGEPGQNRPNPIRKNWTMKRKTQRIQYKFRTRISNKGRYLASYHYNSSGHNQRPFSREFHKRQMINEYSASTNNGPQHPWQ